MGRNPRPELTAEEQRRLDAGDHEALAESLRARGRADLAGWVLEQIWDFDGAGEHYLEATELAEALRVALHSSRPDLSQRVLRQIEAGATHDPKLVDTAIALLEKRGRHADAARLMTARLDDPRARAQALRKAGQRLEAARLLADAGHVRDALAHLEPFGEGASSIQARTLAARLRWALGDAEGCARDAQRALRAGADDDELRALLARALGSLGHDLAAQLVLPGEQPDGTPVPGRYRVTGVLGASLTGAAYVGFDRMTLQELEIHLLLADQPSAGAANSNTRAALERFAAAAEAGAALGHPAVRPIVRMLPEAGLLVMPRAEGPDVRTLIRAPGMLAAPGRARALVAFLLQGLARAHARGLVHGGIYPSQLVTDALGRPLLGPFGTQHVSGLAATRTASLEELMIMTAPEVRAGAPPTVESDIYAVGALFAALLLGKLLWDRTGDSPELDIAAAMMAEDPATRPSAGDVLGKLQRPVADLRDVSAPRLAASASGSSHDGESATLARGLEVQAAASWSDDLLDQLCASASPWMQPILDRNERTLTLAGWPASCRTLDATLDSDGWRALVSEDAFAALEPALRSEIEQRLRPSSVVATPSGTLMLALDDLLTR